MVVKLVAVVGAAAVALAFIGLLVWQLAGFRDNGARPGDASYGTELCPDCVGTGYVRHSGNWHVRAVEYNHEPIGV